MKFKYLGLIIFLIILCISAKSNNTINVSGKIIQKENYGAPNYGETPELDSKEVSYYICFDAPRKFIVNGKSSSIKEMQLVFYKSKNAKNDFLSGKNYLFTGCIQPAETGHHHTDFIFIVYDYRLDK
ncbi:hypothetical protein [Treponema sp.]|uniref:hypothetical protein n=1 Tax=Treponema sp. TaxID=166 RepID=UPI00388FC9AD